MPRNYYTEVYTYPEVEEYFRAGTRDQAIMKDFSQILNTTTVGRLIVNAQGTVATPPTNTANVTYTTSYGYVDPAGAGVVRGPYTLHWVEG